MKQFAYRKTVNKIDDSRRMIRTLLFLTGLSLLLSCHSNEKQKRADDLNLSPVIHLEDAKKINSNWSADNTVVVHLTSEPDNLHPSNGGSSPRSEILLQTQGFLLITDFEKQNVAPGLVKFLPEISGDGLKYTYTLRDEPIWDNGEKLSVDDIIFTAKAYKCPFTNNPSVKGYWKNLRSVIKSSDDPKSFTLIMKEPNIQNLTFLGSFCIMQQGFHDPGHVLDRYTLEQLDDSVFMSLEHKDLSDWAASFNQDKFGRDPEYLNGLGPYKVLNWEVGQSVTLVKKKNHWSDKIPGAQFKAYPERIIFKVNKDENSVQLEFKSQQIDVSSSLSMGSFLSLASDSSVSANYHHLLTLTYNYTFLAFNEKPETAGRRKLFTDPQVRRAMAMLCPVDQLMKLVYKDYSKDCRRMVSNVSPLKPEFNSELKAIEQNIPEAEKLFTASGWKDSDGDGILDKMIDGEKIPMLAEITYMNTSSDWKSMATLISEAFAKAGVKIILNPVDLRVFLESARQHNFDLLLASWGGTPFPEDFTQLWHSKSWQNNGSNYTGFGNSESDLLIDSIKTELDTEKRNRMTRRFQKIIYDDQPYIFLFCSMRRNFVHKRFGNVSLFADRPGMLINQWKLLSTTSE